MDEEKLVDENEDTNNEESMSELESEEEIMKSEEEESVLQEVQDASQNKNEDTEKHKAITETAKTTKGFENPVGLEDTDISIEMNSITFYDFYMDIWEKYQCRSRECIDELIAKLDY